MKKTNNKATTTLPDDTIVDVISKHNGNVYKKEMTLSEAKKYHSKDPLKYKIYEKGYSSYPNVINKK